MLVFFLFGGVVTGQFLIKDFRGVFFGGGVCFLSRAWVKELILKLVRQ